MAHPLDDLLAASALDQAAAVRAGDVSVAELTDAVVARVAARNARLGAFVEVAPERARRTARALDAALRRDPHAVRSPLFGLTTGIKDLQLTRGFGARMGSRAFRWVWSPVDDVTSAAVRRAGMVILGKLSTSELGILPVVETDLHPPTRNPWDEARTAGGSSGGAGAAVGGGLLPLAPASDGAGSIRIPAAFCGLVGHKPSRDLVPNPYATFETIGLAVVGPHARSVEDAAALLDVLVGTPPGPTSFLAACRRAVGPLRIRATTTTSAVETDPAVVAATERVAAVLGALGHEVLPGDPFVGDWREFVPMFEFLASRTPVLSERRLQPISRWLRGRGRQVSPATAASVRDDFTRRALGWFEGTDVWLTPTVAVPPPPVGAWAHLPPEEGFAAYATLGAFTAVLNASGMPAITIPVRVDGHPWPVGVQLAARQGEDARLLALARAVLEALGTPLLPAAD